MSEFQAENKALLHYPFGMLMPGRNFGSETYRFGFNSKENDNEVKGAGNSLDFGARIYDSRLGRWLSVDPLTNQFPNQSPSSAFNNDPIYFIDPDGKIVDDYYRNSKGELLTVVRIDDVVDRFYTIYDDNTIRLNTTRRRYHQGWRKLKDRQKNYVVNTVARDKYKDPRYQVNYNAVPPNQIPNLPNISADEDAVAQEIVVNEHINPNAAKGKALGAYGLPAPDLLRIVFENDHDSPNEFKHEVPEGTLPTPEMGEVAKLLPNSLAPNVTVKRNAGYGNYEVKLTDENGNLIKR